MATKVPLRESDPVHISSYRLLGRLGEGGMGVVYLAETPDGHLVAVKVIRDFLAEDSDFRARFRSEVANASKVPRFCTAPILDADTEADPPYIVTEYIDGPTLGSLVADRGPLPSSQLHALGVGIASALGAIHHAGVVHRDLKPGNVLLSRFGPQVIDFGIARAVDAVTHLTQPGRVMGSPAFMAPEQLRGLDVTVKADIFSWGAVMAYAGTAREPFGATTDTVYFQVLYGQPSLEGLEPDLAEVVAKTLRKEPDDRPGAPELLDALVRSTGLPPGQNPPWQVPSPLRLPATQPRHPATQPRHAPAARPTTVAAGERDAISGELLPAPHESRKTRREAHRTVGTRRLARWLAAGIAGIVVGGALAYGTISYLDFRTGRDRSADAVSAYLADVKAGRFEAAYGRLCVAARQGLSRQTFVQRHQSDAAVVDYSVDRGSVPFTLGDAYTVHTHVRRADGSTEDHTYVVQPVAGAAGYSVCLSGG